VRSSSLLGLALVSLVLVACGGDARYAPPLDPRGTNAQTEGEAEAEAQPARPGASERAPQAELEGVLDVIGDQPEVPSFLGALHAVAYDASGRVIGGADAESTTGTRLSLVLPAGTGYRLELSSETLDAAHQRCRARIEPLRIAAGAVGRVQVLAWECGDRTGYVPRAVSSDCYWLADWAFVARISAPVGEVIDVRAVRHDSTASLAVHWSATSPNHGGFEDPEAAETSFRCGAKGALALTAAFTDGACEQRITQAVDCF
jgi:hypothetical protein